MRKISEIMHDAVMQNFEEEGRPKWVPLSPKTIRARERKGYWPGKILQQRGRLAASIVTRWDNDSAVVGVAGAKMDYAAIHQFGGMAGRNKKVYVPPRPYLQLTDRDMAEILEYVQEYVNLYLRRRGNG